MCCSRNGVDLGVAFDSVPCGRGIAYFPAISLSQNERVKVNFGATPFRHPTPDYLPLDETPHAHVEQADFLLRIFQQAILFGKQQTFASTHKTKVSWRTWADDGRRRDAGSLLVVAILVRRRSEK